MRWSVELAPGPAQAWPDGAARARGVLVGELEGRYPEHACQEGQVQAGLTDEGVEIVAGLGDRSVLDAEAVRTAAARAAREARRWRASQLWWQWREDLPLSQDQQLRAVIEGAVLGSYEPRASLSRAADDEAMTLVIWGALPDALPDPRPLLSAAEWANRCRTLVNAGGNDVTPERLAQQARELAERHDDVECEVLGPVEMQTLGMGALLAVAQGSAQAPRLITVRYRPPQAVPGQRLVLVGKAVTFDAGGLNLKLSPKLRLEKSDMAGGAAVLAALGAIAGEQLPVEVIAVLAACENMTGSGAYRPGDIVHASDGTSIEVVNTDAEGRLALADALLYARTFEPTCLIDVATLTGATLDALGHVYGCLFSSDPQLGEGLLEAGERSGDPLWPWPMHRAYEPLLRSTFADIRNYPEDRRAQPVFGAMFLKRFVGDLPWAHIDICGPANLEEPGPGCFDVEGGTGFGVRLLVEFARELAAGTGRDA